MVFLSRNTLARDIIIVGEPNYAIDRIWSVICQGTQYTNLMDSIINKFSINADGVENEDEDDLELDMTVVHPYKPSNMILPQNKTGFVYLIASIANMEMSYVGQTKCISRRMNEHNSGIGAVATAPASYKPYCLAAYLTGLSHMDKSGRMSLERSWQSFNETKERVEGKIDLETRIEQGRRVMAEHNRHCNEDKKIQLVVTVERTT